MAPARSRIADAAAWDASVPAKRLSPVMNVFSAMPTLPLAEWTSHWLFAMCALHANESNMQLHLGSAAMAGLFTKMVSDRALGRFNLKFTTPASIMVSPRVALYTIETNAVTYYISSIAAKRFGLGGGVKEAALAGLLSCLFQSVMEINGTRFVWWTWHDAAPAVRHRILGVPVLASTLALSLGASHALLADWLLTGDERANYAQAALQRFLSVLPEQNRSLAVFFAQALDQLRSLLFQVHPVFRVVAAGALAVPLHAIVSGVAQVLALDKLGLPTARSLKLMLGAFTMVVASAASLQAKFPKAESLPAAKLSTYVVAYFSVHAAIAAIGDPTKHVSTGLHQQFGRPGVLAKDVFGSVYEENLSGGGPVDASRYDFAIEGTARSALIAELEDKREALEDASKFVAAASKRVAATEQALAEANAWSKEPGKKVPSLGVDQFVRDMEAANTIRVARIKTHLEARLERLVAERARLLTFESKLQTKIKLLEDKIQQSSVDPAGNPVAPASEFGPGSVWYTVRGLASKNWLEEVSAVWVLAGLGMATFTKLLALR